MTVLRSFTVSMALVGLGACVTPDKGAMVKPQQIALDPPPEYMGCTLVPGQLAEADYYTKELGVYHTKGAFWASRAERLSGRAYECKTGRR